MKIAARILGVVLVSWAATAAAQTYRWTDAQGVTHFSDDLAQAGRSGARAVTPQAHLSRIESAPASAASVLSAAGEVRIPFERDGNLILLHVKLNHRIEARFYLDTGSSGVVIPSAVAKRLSLEVGPNAPTVMLQTTAGQIQVPAVQLESVQLGGAELENLEATVSPNLEIGLLGGAFFNEFSYSIDPVAKVLVLRRASSPR